MSIGNTLRTITTPMGRIVCELNDDPDYPALYINLHTPEGEVILLSVVEYSTEDKTIGICSYFDLSQDDPVYHDRINAEDIGQFIKDREP